MRIFKSIVKFILSLIIWIIDGLNELMWKILEIIFTELNNPIKGLLTNGIRVVDEISYTQGLQRICCLLMVLLFPAGWPLSLIFYEILQHIHSHKTKEQIYKVTSILLILSIIWIILPIQKYLPYYLGIVNVTFERIFVSIHPIRVAIALLYYQFDCRTYDFRWTKPQDLKKALEEEEEQIDTYIEEGED